MISIIVTFIFLVSAWKWGDWKNWKHYYPTMQYMIINALLFNIITYEYPTWEWQDISGVFPNHTLLDFWIIFTQFPAVVLLNLSFNPTSFKKVLGRYLLWVAIFSTLEIVVLKIHYIIYDHNWSFGWSVFLNAVTFFMIQFHHRKPLLAWILSFLFIAYLCSVFNLPLTKMR